MENIGIPELLVVLLLIGLVIYSRRRTRKKKREVQMIELGTEKRYDDGMRYCTTCGTKDFPQKSMKGTFFIELVLWLFFIVPGIIYSIWRLSTKTDNMCPHCGATTMIPLDSPIARERLSAAGK